MPRSAGGLRWPRMPRGMWFEDCTAEARARRLAGWLLGRYRATGATNLPTREVLREGPQSVCQVDRLDEALRLLAADGVLQVLRLGRRRWVRIDPVALSRCAPPVPERPRAVGGDDAAARYLRMLG